MFMSSSMRRRSGLMGFSLIGGSCLEVGVLDPSILKTEHPPRHPRSINVVTALKHTASGRAAFSRGSGFVPCTQTDIETQHKRDWILCSNIQTSRCIIEVRRQV